MWLDLQGKWVLRVLTFCVWAAAAASTAYWGLKFVAAPPASGAVIPVALNGAPPVDPLAVARLLGAAPMAANAAPEQPGMASRFALVGVIAARSSAGTALIALDGKPARPYTVGSKVDNGAVLQSVGPRKAVIGAALGGPPSFTLEMPQQQRK